MFKRHRQTLNYKLDCPHAKGADALLVEQLFLAVDEQGPSASLGMTMLEVVSGAACSCRALPGWADEASASTRVCGGNRTSGALAPTLSFNASKAVRCPRPLKPQLIDIFNAALKRCSTHSFARDDSAGRATGPKPGVDGAFDPLIAN